MSDEPEGGRGTTSPKQPSAARLGARAFLGGLEGIKSSGMPGGRRNRERCCALASSARIVIVLRDPKNRFVLNRNPPSFF